jgi:hypothetical protein
MSKRIAALAAVLLAGGIGAAAAQGQTQGQGSGQARKTAPLYTQQVPDTAPLGPHIDKPKVNPSAAGEATGWKDPTPPSNGTGDTREHSGSVGINANTHPWKSLKAGGKPREQGKTMPSGIQPTPYSTMNRDAGR